jgi:hypothetical protein
LTSGRSSQLKKKGGSTVRAPLKTLIGAMTLAIQPHTVLAAPFAVPDMPAADAWALKLSAEHSRFDGGHEWAVPNVELMVPVAPGLEAAVVAGRGHVHNTGTKALEGLSDLEIAAKWELLPVPEQGGFGITVQPVVLVPLGNREVTEDNWRLELPVVFGWRRGALTLHAMTGYSVSLSNRGDAIPFGTLATYDIGETLTLGVELVGSAPVSDFDDYEAEVGAGAVLAFSEGWALEGRVGRTVRIKGEPKATNFLLAIEKSF